MSLKGFLSFLILVHMFTDLQAAVPIADFYPFGDSAHEAIPLPTDGTCGYDSNKIALPVANLSAPFKFAGSEYNAIYPSFHGFISLGQPADGVSCDVSCDRNHENYASLSSPHIFVFERGTSTQIDRYDYNTCSSSLMLNSDHADAYKEICRHPYGSITHHLYNVDRVSQQTAAVFEKAAEEISIAFPGMDIFERINWVYTITYFNVTNNSPLDSLFGCYLGGRFNTYQLALVSTSHDESFLIFKYNQVQWLYEIYSCYMSNYIGNNHCCGLQSGWGTWGGPAQVGIRFPRNERPPISLYGSSICSSDTINIPDNSNMDVPGMFVLKVDGDEIITPGESWSTPTPTEYTTEYIPTETTTIQSTTTTEPNVGNGTCTMITDDNENECLCACTCKKKENTNRFFLLEDVMNWDEANQACANASARLAVVKDEAEHNYILATFTQHSISPYWIGLYRNEQCPSEFQWVDGSCLNESHWSPGQPDCRHNNCTKNCVVYVAQWDIGGEWHDWGCYAEFHPLCEHKERDCDCKCNCIETQ